MAVNRKADKIIKEVKKLCNELFKDKLHDIYLYGSYARGDFDFESDIDILLTLNLTDKQLIKYRDFIYEIGTQLSLKYDKVVSIILVPTKRFSKFMNDLPFYRNVVNEGINYGLN